MNEFKYDYEYLVHLIKCAVYGEKPEEKPDGISFENVLALGKEHEVANLAFQSIELLENKPSESTYNEWKVFYYFSVERDLKQELEYNEIIKLLHSNSIRTLEAQGTVTKTLYPSPELRMMSDIDFIIDKENFEKVEAFMADRGYTVNKLQEYELECIKSSIGSIIEFHCEFFSEYMYNRKERYYKAINSPFDHAEKSDADEFKYILNDTYFYLYSILHIIKHFETAGCGIRRILDIYYLKKAYAGRIDEQLVNNVIDKNDFRKTYDLLFELEAYWFEDKAPSIPLDEAINDVIMSGNHGADEIHTRNDLRKDRKQGIRFAKLKTVIKFIFPSKEYIYLGYPECKERGYSTLRCQIYRMYKTVLKFDFKHAYQRIKSILRAK